MTNYDELWPGGPKLACGNGGFPLSTDSVLLANFVSAANPKNIIDLGCGAGVLSVLLALRYPKARLTGLEIQPQSAKLSRMSLDANGCENARVVEGDLRGYKSLFTAGEYDLVVSNPPYFPVKGGYSAPDEARRIAREEICCTLADVCSAAAWLCKWGGAFYLVHRPERLSEICCAATAAGLEPKRLRMVQYKQDSAPNLVLMEFRRGAKPGMAVEKPLILANADGSDTDEICQMYHRESKK